MSLAGRQLTFIRTHVNELALRPIAAPHILKKQI